jgi:hypothetical protein
MISIEVDENECLWRDTVNELTSALSMADYVTILF